MEREVIERLRKLIEKDPNAVLRTVNELRKRLHNDPTALAVLSIVEAAARLRLLSRQTFRYST